MINTNTPNTVGGVGVGVGSSSSTSGGRERLVVTASWSSVNEGDSSSSSSRSGTTEKVMPSINSSKTMLTTATKLKEQEGQRCTGAKKTLLGIDGLTYDLSNLSSPSGGRSNSARLLKKPPPPSSSTSRPSLIDKLYPTEGSVRLKAPSIRNIDSCFTTATTNDNPANVDVAVLDDTNDSFGNGINGNRSAGGEGGGRSNHHRQQQQQQQQQNRGGFSSPSSYSSSYPTGHNHPPPAKPTPIPSSSTRAVPDHRHLQERQQRQQQQHQESHQPVDYGYGPLRSDDARYGSHDTSMSSNNRGSGGFGRGGDVHGGRLRSSDNTHRADPYYQSYPQQQQQQRPTSSSRYSSQSSPHQAHPSPVVSSSQPFHLQRHQHQSQHQPRPIPTTTSSAAALSPEEEARRMMEERFKKRDDPVLSQLYTQIAQKPDARTRTHKAPSSPSDRGRANTTSSAGVVGRSNYTPPSSSSAAIGQNPIVKSRRDSFRRAYSSSRRTSSKIKKPPNSGGSASSCSSVDSSVTDRDVEDVNDQQQTQFETFEIEVSPGVFMPMRGAEETELAIQSGMIQEMACFCCTTQLCCITTAEFVYCPICSVIGPIESSPSSSSSGHGKQEEVVKRGVGLGLTQEAVQEILSGNGNWNPPSIFNQH